MFSSMILLFVNHQPNLLMMYIFGYVFNIIVNIGLKIIIKEPRPSEDTHLFNLQKNIYKEKRLSFDKYGMPSGHVQKAFFSTIFICLAIKDIKIKLIFIAISLIICYQRVSFKNHTLLQVVVGAIVGSLLGYAFYTYSKKALQGSLFMKKDDNAPK
jgi:membrane-associated phospholipid phosphatase